MTDPKAAHAFLLGEVGGRRAVEDQQAAMVFEGSARLGPGEPRAKVCHREWMDRKQIEFY